ncbi:hypothetical protein [Actinomadura sp. NPDC048394]|uniref:hypothetical protein n=1 Tax=Actinomadura sp. NPDC048394 TaxID=3158223 RepID=UPI0033EFD902
MRRCGSLALARRARAHRFPLQSDDFVIAGVLPSIVRSLAVGEAAASHLVTAFSVICAVADPQREQRRIGPGRAARRG